MLHIDAASPAPNAIAQIVREIVRTEMNRIVTEASDTALDADAQAEAAEERLAEIKTALRGKAYDSVAPLALEAAGRLGLTCPVPLGADDARTVMSALKKLAQIELNVHEDGEDPLEEGLDLLARHDIAVRDGKLPPLFRLSDAKAAALVGQTKEKTKKITVAADLAIEFLGDIPLEQFADRIFDLMLTLSLLPKLHGKTHGNNRYTNEKEKLSKREEIALADLADDQLYAALRAEASPSDAEKRARLAELLTVRMADTNLKRHLDRLHEMMRAAAKAGYQGRTKLMTYQDLERLIAVEVEKRRAANPLYVRVTQPKIRLRWAGERIRRLLTSPIYRGCFSSKRRTRPGRQILRDAIYWAPLILLTMGTRVTEVLQLLKRDLILRDGVHCLRLCWSAEQDGKTVSSTRIVPIPQILLELGFVEWIKSLDQPSSPLFPEILKADADDPAQIFTKRMNTVRKNLGIADFNEDLYAMRKTLSSALWKGGVSAENRQMIIGHVSDTTIGKHYTEADLATLKSLLDRADHAIVVTTQTRHRFPVVADCTLVSGVPARAEVVLDANGDLGAIRVLREHDDRRLIAVAIKEAKTVRPAWPEMKILPRRDAPDAVADLMMEYHIAPPGNSRHRAAYDHLVAMASPTAASTRTSKGQELELAA